MPPRLKDKAAGSTACAGGWREVNTPLNQDEENNLVDLDDAASKRFRVALA